MVWLLNALVTGAVGGVILYNLVIRKLDRHPFYYAWSLGFILYGVQIAFRAFFGNTLLGTIWVITAFALFLGGIWSLSRSKLLMYSTFSIYFLSIIIALFFFRGTIQFTHSITVGLTVNFVPVAIAMLYHRAIFGRTVDKLVLGWFSLYLSNMLLFETGWILDVFAIFFKFIILLGIMDYDFIIITDKIRRRQSSTFTPSHTSFEREGGLKLVISNHAPSQKRKIDWITAKAHENIKKGISTYIFSFQDVIPHKELWRIKWFDPKNIFIYLFSSSAERVKTEFVIFPMGLAQIGAVTSEVVKKYTNSDKGCTIIFLDISILTHYFGINRVYEMILNKLGSIRENKVELFALIHPETHSEASTVSLFKSIADEVIQN